MLLPTVPAGNDSTSSPSDDASEPNSSPGVDRKKTFYSDLDAKPVVPRPDIDCIPAELKAARRWVAWKLVWNAKKGTWDKVPVDPRTRRNAKANQPKTWGAFEDAEATLAANADLAGLGYQFEENAGEFGIDLDDCRNPETGVIAEWAQEILALYGTYAEVSPSGTGVKLFGRGKLPYTRKLPDREAYDSGRFFTVTGRPVPGSAQLVADCQTVIDAHFTRLFPPNVKKPASRTRPVASRVTGRQADPDDKLLDRIRASHQGPKFQTLFDNGDISGYGNDDSRADMALCFILAWWCRKDAAQVDRLFRRSKLFRGKWDDPRGQETYGSVTIARAIGRTEGEYDPTHRNTVVIRGFAGVEPEGNNHDEMAHPTPPVGEPHEPSDPGSDIPEPDPDDDDELPDDETSPAGDSGGDDEKKSRASAASQLVKLAREASVALFHTPDQNAYAQVPRDGRIEVHSVKGTQFRRFLARTFFQAEGKAVNSEAMATAIATLEAIALFDCPEHPVHLRVAPGCDGSVVLDLCDDLWRAVIIRPGGWEVTHKPPVMFTRSTTMRPLPEPVRSGQLTDLRRFLNLKSDDDWLLVAAWLAAALRPSGPYPLLHPKGEPGTAKTTFGRMLRRLFDPNKVDLKSQPREERDLAVSSRHGWAVCYDNLSAVPLWLSDALCRVATGGGFGTRALYTDDEEVTFDFMRPVLITSIEDVIGQPDLLDRSLAIELEPIPDHKRKTEAALWAEFDAAKPGILGGLLDAVAEALAILPTVVAENRPVPRMADFAIFGEAVARALGEAPGQFLEILLATRSGADQDALQGSPLALSFFRWVQDRRAFNLTVSRVAAKARNSTVGLVPVARLATW